MGDYNPNRPQIIGNELTGIRNVDLRPDVSAEYATGLTLTGSTQVSQARFSVAKMDSRDDEDIVYAAAMYPKGTMGQTGPIQSCLIPVTNVSVTGGTSAPDTAGDYVAALYGQSGRVELTSAASFPNVWPLTGMWARFKTSDYAFLATKRILGVNIMTNIVLSENTDINGNIFSPMIGFINTNNPGVIIGSFTAIVADFPLTEGVTIFRPNDFVPHPNLRLKTGAVAPSFMSPSAAGRWERPPWTYAELNTLLGAAGSWYFAIVFGPNFTGTGTRNDRAIIFYLAMEVIYCEEKRIVAGGFRPGDYIPSLDGFEKIITMRQIPALTTNPIVAAGSYDLSLTRADEGYFADEARATSLVDPVVNAFRYLHEVPPYNGTILQIPESLPDSLGQELVTVQTTILPQLTIHTSGGPIIADSQAFGQSIAAEVWGSNFARQQIRDPASSGLSYTWIKFWARHWSGTTASLAVDYSGTPLLTLTPAQVDAYPLIADRWHEVTATIPATTLTPTGFINWSSAAATVNTRWEIIGVASPALTGLPGSLYNLATNQNDNATYDGATSALTWIPNGVTNVPVTTPTRDTASDASVFLGVAPGAPSGFAGSIQSQALVGIGLDCGITPDGIADHLFYNRLTWNTPASSGFPNFGYYELQRQDTVTDWQTIMAATNPAATGFNDYEARPGMQSSYRIRTVTDQGFFGPWTATVNLTLTDPGASGGASFGQGHILLFTSNEVQNGSVNLAYASTWDGAGAQAEESFNFPEAGFVQLQAMYNKDFFTAFRPLERGGEQFQRNVLVQAAAIAPETLADFTSLRDLAWDSLSYVCVRDEDGNRWFASVTVPEGRVRLNRTIYIASVNIVEVTATSTQVNP